MVPKVNGWLILAGVSSTALLAACAQIAPVVLPRLTERTGPTSFSVQITPLPIVDVIDTSAVALRATPTARARAAATPTPNALANRQLVPARRGAIQETVQLGGRVAPVQEAPLSFSIRGSVDSVTVQPGETVAAGQLLLTLDSTEAARQSGDLRAELEITRARQDQLTARVEQIKRQKAADAQARDEAAARREQTNQQRIADATTRAQEQLRLAQVNLDKVKAGAPSAERLVAEGAVATARGNLAKAETDLARLKSGPTAAERRAAEQLLATVQIALKKAQTDRDKLLLPPDPSVVATAKKDVAGAQADVERAGSRDSSPNAIKISDTERQARQTAAEFALKAATERLDALLKGPDKASVELANMAVESTRTDLASAQAHLQELIAPPTSDQLNAAVNAVEVGQFALKSAEAHLVELRSHPTSEELRVAQKAFDDAQLALDRAAEPVDTVASAGETSSPLTGPQDAEPTLVDRLTLQRTFDQQQAQIQALQQQVAASQIRAPFAGIVESVQVKSGDAAEPRRTVVMLASGDSPVVSVDVPDTYAPRLAPGSIVTIQVEASPTQVDGTLAVIGQSTSGSSRPAVIQVSWPDEPPRFGANVQVSAVVSQKSDAVLIPQRAVKVSGERRTVEVLDGQERRTVDVKLGIASGIDVEILNGLVDGQMVIMPG